jgi:enamine deaminase RidA (YjgF/YER057c/UK114 family)
MTVAEVGGSKLIFIAGLVAEDSALNGAGQIREVLGIIDKLLEHVGARPIHIVSMRIYLADQGEFSVMKTIWDSWTEERRMPARMTIGAKLVSNEWKVEVDLTAAFTPLKSLN